ncbi:MAG: glycosyl transferase, family 9 [Actinomycetia bacterium]|nr:glycosyl transferase, family 9 [Actinomycetes bacterium]
MSGPRIRRVLAVRSDGLGDVVLTGPAVRAIASRATVVMACAPGGVPAARALPGVREVVELRLPWIDAQPLPIGSEFVAGLTTRLCELDLDEAVIFTSFHQSALPLALLLRSAGVPKISAISVDYPGALLDVRHQVDDDVHEVLRNLSLVRAAGYEPARGDDDRLRLDVPAVAPPEKPAGPYVVVHPGASVPARTWSPKGYAALVTGLAAQGQTVCVTGGASESPLTAVVAGPPRPEVLHLGGRLDFGGLLSVIAGADVVVVGNTGPAHVAAAVGTSVVSMFPPTVPATRWRPWGVPCTMFGAQEIACAGCRATRCPQVGHPCLDHVRVGDVVAAVLGHAVPAQDAKAGAVR